MKLPGNTETEQKKGGGGGKRGEDGFYDADTDLHEIRMFFFYLLLLFFTTGPFGEMRLGSGYAV